MTTKLKILLFLTSALVLLDQVTKVWTVAALRYTGARLPEKNPLSFQSPWDGLDALGHSMENPREITIIDGFLALVHRQNPGAAIGILDGFEGRLVVFYVFTAVATGVLISMYRQLADDDRFQTVTISLILSGAFGNFIDRLHKSTVTDMVKVYTENPTIVQWLADKGLPNEYPTWNVADAAIVVGVAFYLLQYLVFERDKGDSGDVGPSPLDQDESAPKPS